MRMPIIAISALLVLAPPASASPAPSEDLTCIHAATRLDAKAVLPQKPGEEWETLKKRIRAYYEMCLVPHGCREFWQQTGQPEYTRKGGVFQRMLRDVRTICEGKGKDKEAFFGNRVFAAAASDPPACPEWADDIRQSQETARKMPEKDRKFMEAVIVIDCREFIRVCQPKKEDDPCE